MSETIASEEAGKIKETDKQVKQPSLLEDLMYLLAKAAILGVAVFTTFTFIFGIARVRDMAMKPAIMEGDLVFYMRTQKKYAAGELVVLDINGVTQVRRVAAVAGDTVDITEDGLLINGYRQQESNIYTSTMAYQEGISFPIKLNEGEIFVLGDKRDGAEDSRIYGQVKASATLGKVMSIVRRRNF